MVRSASRSSFLFEHDLFGKPDSTPDQVRGRLFPDHALDFGGVNAGPEPALLGVPGADYPLGKRGKVP
jgi:hypothetical protein